MRAGPSKWEDLGNPAVGAGPKCHTPTDAKCSTTASTFNSQSTFVLPLTTAATTTTIGEEEEEEEEAAEGTGQGQDEGDAVALWMGDRWYPTRTYPKEPHSMLEHNATYVWLNLIHGPNESLPLVMKWEGDIVPGKSTATEAAVAQ